MTYRKKPVLVEAIQFLDSTESLMELGDMGLEVVVDYADPENPVLRVETLNGVVSVCVGEWIIKGVRGEFYPCKPDIFEQTYEPHVSI